MTYYAMFDDDGLPLAFYTEAVHGAKTVPTYTTPAPTEGDPDPQPVISGSEPNPDCKIPADAIAITDAQWQEFVANPGLRKWDSVTSTVVTYTPPAPVPTEADYSAAILAMLDAKAKERQYDSINTAISYRDDPNVGFAAEGKALFDWRSSVWTYATAQLAAVKAGTRAQPSVADFVSEIEEKCSFSWPAEAAA